ncbi:MAG: hypothetical protein MUE60_00530 [Candidatus Eisenbacteria bacterium]|nr:hypothetical protein [Candidatus Eisenbacteria bacterium]
MALTAWLLTCLLTADPGGHSPPHPVGALVAADVPNDKGGAISLTWQVRAEDAARIRWQLVQRATSPGQFVVVDSLPAFASSAVIDHLPNGVPSQYRIVLVDGIGRRIPSIPTPPVASRVQWFNQAKANLLVITLLLSFAVIIYIERAKRGRRLFIRRIAGLEAIEEAVGRATEMGRAVLFVPGINDMDDVQTLAGLSILQTIARTTAEYDTPLDVPVSRSLVMSAARETVKEAYLAAGRPDAYREDSVHYVTDAQFGYVAAVDGIMVRERPAATFYLGAFFAESLVLAETGNSIGAIQVSGTAMPAQLPFFVAACDYTLIGEELFAASAYLSQEPRMLGSLKGQDVGKLLAMLFIAAGAIAETVASLTGGNGPAAAAAAFLRRLFAMNF